MFKLVVLCAVVAVAVAKPHVIVAGYTDVKPVATYSAEVVAPAIATATSYQTRTDIVSKPVIAAAIAPAVTTYAAVPAISTYAAAPAATTYASGPAVTTYAASPSVTSYGPSAVTSYGTPVASTNEFKSEVKAEEPVVAAKQAEGYKYEKPENTESISKYSAPVVSAYATPVVAAYAAPAVATHTTHYAAVPVTGTAYTKNVHYAEKDVVTGYNAQIYKPDLTGLEPVAKTTIVEASRPVHTITPTVTKVEPEVTVNKVQLDVPVHTPVVSEVEVRTPIVKAAPALAYTEAHYAPSVGYAGHLAAATPVAFSGHLATHLAAAAPVAYSAHATHVSAPVAYAAHTAQVVAPVAHASFTSHVSAPAAYTAYSSHSIASPLKYEAQYEQKW